MPVALTGRYCSTKYGRKQMPGVHTSVLALFADPRAQATTTAGPSEERGTTSTRPH